jgi:bifunctional DNA-binding transcriptional regulator/antitoxin component of YhaV-PrlF toxin-antitoxin module
MQVGIHAEAHVVDRQLGESRVWGRGYTTIPAIVRRILDLKVGDTVGWFITDEGDIVVRKVKRGGKRLK